MGLTAVGSRQIAPRRPVTKFITRTTTAISSKMWI
jgi:hypothetical protein